MVIIQHRYNIFVVVNFDALAQLQASDFRIERRQVVFLCWMQDSNPGSQTPNRQQTAFIQPMHAISGNPIIFSLIFRLWTLHVYPNIAATHVWSNGQNIWFDDIRSRPLWFCLISKWPLDAMWRHRSGSRLTLAVAFWLTAPNHHLSWLIIRFNFFT